MKTALCLPMMGSLPCEMVGPLMGLAAEIKSFGELAICTISDYAPHDRAREYLVNTAIDAKCDYLMFVDADTITPEITFGMLYPQMLKTKAALISGHYYRRGFPFTSHWSRRISSGVSYVESTPHSGTTEIDCCGLGCALVDMKFVSLMSKPFFKIAQNSKGDTIWEDAYFCKKIQDVGGKIFATSDVRCGHLYTRTVICDGNADNLRRLEIPHA